MNPRTIRVSQETFDLIKDAENEYRRHHKELNEIFLSKNKIIYEALQFYLKN